MAKTLEQLKTELSYAVEGLAQMQEPEAGYFENINDKQDHEVVKFNQDVKAQSEGIARLEKQIMQLEIEQA